MEPSPDTEIVHRELRTDIENPAVQVAEIVAELRGVTATELPSIWECIDDVLDNVFSNPPSPEAQLELEFTYQGYRVRVDQDGHASFLRVD